MTEQRVVIAGATGNLGARIARELRKRSVSVCVIARPGTSPKRLEKLRKYQLEIVEADLHARAKVVEACRGASCVISSLLGLESTLVDAQTALLEAAVEAGVPRFIPSDYAMDFAKIEPGVNRNFDIHKKFRERLLSSPIRSTSILNGAFMDLLIGEAPLVLSKIKRILYWGENPEQQIDFTTMDNTAAYTAAAALDLDAPKILRISGEQISAAKLAKDAPFPVWQGMQYLYCMFEGSGMLTPLDNARYPNMHWTSVGEVLRNYMSVQMPS